MEERDVLSEGKDGFSEEKGPFSEGKDVSDLWEEEISTTELG